MKRAVRLIPAMIVLTGLIGLGKGSFQQPCTAAQAGSDVDHAATGKTDETVVAGKTVTQWREVMKNLDPQQPIANETVNGLIELAENRELPWFTRRQAALTLGRIGKPARAAVPRLVALIDERAEQGESPALWSMKALGLFGPVAADASKRLAEIVNEEASPFLHRLVAIEALSRIGEPAGEVMPTLIGLIAYHPRSSDVDVQSQAATIRELAAESLTLFGPQAAVAVPALVRACSDESEKVRRKAVGTLASIGPTAEIAVPTLVDVLLFDESAAVRDQAEIALAKIGPASLPFLRKLSASEDEERRFSAVRGVRLMGVAARGAESTIRARLTDPSPRIRVEAAGAAWEVLRNSSAAIPVLLAEFGSEDRQLRILAYRRLLAMGEAAQRAIPQLKNMAVGADPVARQTAEKALRQLTAE